MCGCPWASKHVFSVEQPRTRASSPRLAVVTTDTTRTLLVQEEYEDLTGIAIMVGSGEITDFCHFPRLGLPVISNPGARAASREATGSQTWWFVGFVAIGDARKGTASQ